MVRAAPSRRSELIAYFALAFILSWAIEIPLALSAQGLIHRSPPMALHYLASFGPMLAALLVTLFSHGLSGVGQLLTGLLRWRTPREYYAFAVAAPIVIFIGIVFATWLVRGTPPDLRLLGEADYLGSLGVLPVFALWVITFGLGEELGWRGFALPRLQATRSALAASFVLGSFWAVWHLPAIFYRDTYMAMGWMVVPMLLTVAAVGSVVYTWLFNGTRGSLLVIILFHGLFDFFSVWPAGLVGPGMVMTILMVFWAVRVYKIFGAEHLAPVEKTVV
ncbi:MAG: CPBP family intramembrane metalloprotease [Chloroflexi bacterium]|nr:CPBP family intramembrane metalloprotease [Chloroflexota bacterium]